MRKIIRGILCWLCPEWDVAGLIGYCLYIDGVKYEIVETMECFASFFVEGSRQKCWII